MANEQVIQTSFRLSEDQKRVMNDLEGSIDQAEMAIQGLEEAGMDVTALKEELRVAKVRRDALLKYFG